MTPSAGTVLAMSRDIPVDPETLWRALTMPALMHRWMLVPACIVPDAPLEVGSRIEWQGEDPAPYLVGTVTLCVPLRHLRVELQDRSWSRPAAPGEVVWEFVLTPHKGGVRLDYRLGDLAIDADAEGWLAAYRAADEPARLAALLEEVRP
jgi:uncharacterized protein YndB with AHSA1/START domain